MKIVAAAMLGAMTAMTHAETIPAAQSSGPIAVTAQSGEPYRGANEQPVAGPGLSIPALAPYGYIEEEYFVSGAVDGSASMCGILVSITLRDVL